LNYESHPEKLEEIFVNLIEEIKIMKINLSKLNLTYKFHDSNVKKAKALEKMKSMS